MATKSKKTKTRALAKHLPAAIQEVKLVQLVRESEIASLIAAFEPVNPSHYLLFNRKVERDAAERLIQRHGVEKVMAFIRVLPQIHSDQFCPSNAVCLSPFMLEKRLGYAIAHWARMQQRKVDGAGKPESMDFRGKKEHE